jgi:hypothetical protein
LRKISKAIYLALAGRKLRYLKLLAGRPGWELSNLGDLKNHRPEIYVFQTLSAKKPTNYRIPGRKIAKAPNG